MTIMIQVGGDNREGGQDNDQDHDNDYDNNDKGGRR